tara:strand:- start:44702 stop:45994 length:1293 start_codon:yes stop_codon:yes gene_type:complete
MKLRFLNSNLLFKASFFNAIIVVLKMFCGIITSKVVASFLGPTGLALLGNFKNFTQLVLSFTATGYQNGTVRYISEFSHKNRDKNKITTTIFQLSLGLALLIGIILWMFSKTWSIYLFKSEDYNNAIKILAIGLPFLSFNFIIVYILNGLERYKKLVIINSIFSIVNMLVIVILVIDHQLTGALLGVILGPVIVFILSLFVLGEEKKNIFNIFKFKLFSFKVLKKMNIYFLMSIYSAVIVSITFLLIRNLIIEKLSIQEAGYWEAMNRISSFYLMFFISLTSFYLLPRLSKINDFKVFKKEIKGFYILIIPLLLISFILIYFLRYFLLKLFLTEEFLPTSILFFWQLIGDFISVLAIALVKQFHAKLMFKAYLISNGVLNLLYYCLSYCFIDVYGLVGVARSYAVSYLIYLLVVIIFILQYYNKKNRCIE